MVETAIFERNAVFGSPTGPQYFTIGWNALEGLVTQKCNAAS